MGELPPELAALTVLRSCHRSILQLAPFLDALDKPLMFREPICWAVHLLGDGLRHGLPEPLSAWQTHLRLL